MTEPGKEDNSATWDEWITTAEAADILKVTQRWVTQLIERGTLKGKKITPKLWMVTRKSVEEYRSRR